MPHRMFFTVVGAYIPKSMHCKDSKDSGHAKHKKTHTKKTTNKRDITITAEEWLAVDMMERMCQVHV